VVIVSLFQKAADPFLSPHVSPESSMFLGDDLRGRGLARAKTAPSSKSISRGKKSLRASGLSDRSWYQPRDTNVRWANQWPVQPRALNVPPQVPSRMSLRRTQ
jgi:hypothetical protein